MNNLMTELQTALRELGHGAEPVTNAPADMLNVWLNDEGRIPSATVLYEPLMDTDHGQIVWGSHYEHQATTAVGVDELARQIVASCQA